MAEVLQPAMNVSAGHLSVHLEDSPPEVPFLFERQPKRMGMSFAASFAFDLALISLIVLLGRYKGHAGPVAFLPDSVNSDIVWLNQPGPGGGGGGGGNQMK